jgi:hypothetical protein
VSIKIMTMVWDAAPLSGSELLCLLAMADWANDDGGSLHPSMRAIGEKIRVSEKQARRIVQGLVDAGYLSVVGNPYGGAPGTTKQWVINVRKLRELAAQKQAEEAQTAPMDVTPPTGVPDFSDSGLGTSTPAAQAPKGSKKRQAKTPLPQDFGVSDRVRKWAEERGYDRLDEHLEAFRRKAAARGYTYASWDDAFMEAIREDWAKLRDRQPAMRAAPIETYGEREEARKRRLYEEMAGRRPAATVIDVGAVDAIDAVLAVPGIGRNWT